MLYVCTIFSKKKKKKIIPNRFNRLFLFYIVCFLNKKNGKKISVLVQKVWEKLNAAVRVGEPL